MFKISTKLTIWYLFATSVIIAAMAFTMYYIYEDQRRSSIDTDLIEYADFLTNGLAPEGEDMDSIFDWLLTKKDKAQKKLTAHRFFLASNDSVAYEKNALKTLISTLIEKEDPASKTEFNTIKIEDMEYRTYKRSFKISNKKEYQLVVFTSLDRLYDSLNQLRSLFIGIIPISIFAAGIVGFIIARRAMSPVKNLTKIASKLSSTNLDSRVPISKSNDELSLLAKTFNEMINRLDISFKSHKRFIADASHDFKTPLTIIQIELEMLLENKKLDEDSSDNVQKSLKEVDRLSKLADDLLFLAKADANTIEPKITACRLDELVLESVVQLSAIAQKKNINIIPQINEPVEINGDEALLTRAIINGLDNAIKFSDESEEITIDIKTKGKNIELEIINTCKNFDPEFLPFAFERFKKGDNSRSDKGFGLGLAIINAIITAHSGKALLLAIDENRVALRLELPKA